MIIPCGAHSDAAIAALDAVGVADWAIVQTAQCRRMGHIEYRPPEHEWTCDVIMGMSDSVTVQEALDALTQAVHGKELCPDCLVYTWQAEQVLLADSAVDPVCNMAVDLEDALSVAHEGKDYFFCSQFCLDRFVKNPEAFLRPHRAARGGR